MINENPSYIVQVLKNTDKKSRDETDPYYIYCKYYEKQKKQAEEILKINDANELNENLNEKLAFQIEDFIRDLGLSLEKTFSLEVSGKIQNKEITINSNDIPERQNFTMAHELGHYFLHLKDTGTKRVDYRGLPSYGPTQSKEEDEADEFAGELLMPKNILQSLFNHFKQVITTEQVINQGMDLKSFLEYNLVNKLTTLLAGYFHVSVPAMIVRLKKLNLISPFIWVNNDR